MNDIAKCMNDLVTFKTQCLLLNTLIYIGQLFKFKTFIIVIYFLNYSSLFFLKYNYFLAIWLKIYNSSNKTYISNDSILKILITRFIPKF